MRRDRIGSSLRTVPACWDCASEEGDVERESGSGRRGSHQSSNALIQNLALARALSQTPEPTLTPPSLPFALPLPPPCSPPQQFAAAFGGDDDEAAAAAPAAAAGPASSTPVSFGAAPVAAVPAPFSFGAPAATFTFGPPAAPPSALDAVVSARHLAARAAVPQKPAAVPLSGRFALLEPYDEAAHLDALWAATSGGPYLGHAAYDAERLVWRYLWGAPAGREELRTRLAERAALPDSRSWALRLRGSGAVVGHICLMASRPADLVAEVGMVIVTPALQGSALTTDAVFALLRHAFALGYRRVEWKTNVHNARSRVSAERNGFVFEGVFRHHMIVQDGHSRDTAWYAMLEQDFSGSKARAAEAWIASDAAAMKIAGALAT